MPLYNVLKYQIISGCADGLSRKIDVFFAANKLTFEQYDELMKMLAERGMVEVATF